MKPLSLDVVKIEPMKIGNFSVDRLEIDLRHINHGLDPKTKDFRIRPRSNLSTDEVIMIFRLLDNVVIEPTSISGGHAYFTSEVYPFWLKSWFRLIFCIELKTPKTAGVITIYQIKRK